MNLAWPQATGLKWPAADFTAGSGQCAISVSVFFHPLPHPPPGRFWGPQQHLRFVGECYSKVFLFFQIEVRGHEVKKLLGQKLGLRGEHKGREEGEETWPSPEQPYSGVYRSLSGMLWSSRATAQMIFMSRHWGHHGANSQGQVTGSLRPSGCLASW